MIYSNITQAGSPTLPSNAQSGATITLGPSALQTVVDVTTGASDSTLTLPTTGAVDGSLMYVRKVDSGAGKVVINTTLAYLMTINDIILVRYNGSSWEAVEWTIAPVADIFSASGTWTKRPLLLSINVYGIGAGGGGGSGRKGAAASIRSGGAGAQGGSYNEREILASTLSATETVTISAGGAGGASVTTDSTSGAIGSTSGNCTFGTKITSLGASGGSAGTTSSVAGGSALAHGFINPTSGGATSVSANSGTAPTSSVSASGGGGGGPGVDALGNSGAGGAGADGCFYVVNYFK